MLDVVGQMGVARARLYEHLRSAGFTPDESNLKLLGIIRWWSLRSTAGWALLAIVTYAADRVAQWAAWSMADFVFKVAFAVSIALTTTAAVRLVGLGRRRDIERYLTTKRDLTEMIDGHIR